MIADSFDISFGRDDDEGLFSRDVNGQLVRLDAPTESDYSTEVTLQIDGRTVTVPLAEPLKDADQNIVLDPDGRTTPRYTTIFDAAVKAYEEHKREAVPQGATPAQLGTDPEWREFPIPVLCHQQHMKPVAVCRVCVVQIYGRKRGQRARERRLLPACQHRVVNGMEVFTMLAPGPDGERVRQTVSLMAELLAADHLSPAVAGDPTEPFNELRELADRCGLKASRFSSDLLTIPADLFGRRDDSSPVFVVDHSACILCDRCSRACDEVKLNQVIGRTGKGTTARIGFDLNAPMGESSCVQCGECMVSCPTSAITFRPVGRPKPPAGGEVETISAVELKKHTLFKGVPFKFLLWQERLVWRRRVKAGDVLCRQGEPGNTAFIIAKGKFRVTARPQGAGDPGSGVAFPLLAGRRESSEQGSLQLIIGEEACLNGTRRGGDVIALEDGEVWEVRRNLLERIRRTPAQRASLETIDPEETLGFILASTEVFKELSGDEQAACVEFLKPRLSFIRVSRGQVIFEQGDPADNLYLIRRGHVRIGVRQFGREVTTFYRGPGSVIGETGVLALSSGTTSKTVDAIDRGLSELLHHWRPDGATDLFPVGRRIATCSALDHLDVARIRRNDFLEMIRAFPSVRRGLISLSLKRLKETASGMSEQETASGSSESRVGALRQEYIRQGLYQGQSLLVLDLDRCTRCDQCTEACVEQHGTESHGVPITRLLRQGLRFDKYLVTTACRSCKDAYCLLGCPVDAIHRGKHGQIVIEDHCIGCGLCANNCPYGNIFMPLDQRPVLPGPGSEQSRARASVRQFKAATCDLCDAHGLLEKPVPRCVYACPHGAAIRLTGEELLERVIGTVQQNAPKGQER